MPSRRFELEYILACVALTKEASSPAMLKPLLDLLEYMTGERFGPNIVPDFQIQVVTCGLALVRQHPQLDDVRFRTQFFSQQDHEDWVAEQKRSYGNDLPVSTIRHVDLSPYREQTAAIVQRILRRYGR